MDDLSVKVGNQLRELRKARGLSQSAVARKIGQLPCVVWRWENGEFCPGAYWLIKLADYFGCTTDEILGRTSNEHS